MLKLLFASDSFKGTLTSAKTAELLTRAAREVFADGVICTSVPVADGGEGTVDAVIEAQQGGRVEVTVHGPLMDPVKAYYGLIPSDQRSGSSNSARDTSEMMSSETVSTKAVIEMAAASGLTLIPPQKRNPLYTTTYGTGELIRDALSRGCRDLSIAIGGSATNDGGMGCFKALGARFLDSRGSELDGCGKYLEKVSRIDLSQLDPRLRESRITVMCDVNNPLCGENGATYTFGPQKGAGPEELKRLERGMQNYRDVIIRQFGDVSEETVSSTDIPGGGAAGGLGAALAVFADAQMRSGIETVLDLVDFDRKLEGTGPIQSGAGPARVDLVITGEGRTDAQSSCGKVLQGVGEHARAKGIPAIALSGSLGDGYEEINKHGICSVMTCVDRPMPLDEALNRAEELYYKAALRLFRLIRSSGP